MRNLGSKVLPAAMLSLLLLAAPASAQDAGRFGESFWSRWGDGRGELSAYDLVFPRYGEARHGTAVTVFVTEPFTVSARVKADPGKHPDSDVVQVMKLNLVRDFQTGIYDYNAMNSVFVALEPAGGMPPGTVLKSVFSSQEWCGQVYAQLLVDRQSIRHDVFSYFDGEDKGGKLESLPGGMPEDAVLLWARGLAGPLVAPGETRRIPVLGSLTAERMNHRPLAWKSAVLSASPRTGRVTVPAGTFETETRKIEIEQGASWTFEVEAQPPHRIIRWSSSTGESAELLGTERLPYWQMNGEQFRDAVRKLGLTPRPPRTM